MHFEFLSSTWNASGLPLWSCPVGWDTIVAPVCPSFIWSPPPPKKKSMEWLSVIYLSLLWLLLVEKIDKVEKEFLSAVYLSWLVCLLDCGKE